MLTRRQFEERGSRDVWADLEDRISELFRVNPDVAFSLKEIKEKLSVKDLNVEARVNATLNNFVYYKYLSTKFVDGEPHYIVNKKK